MSDPVRIWAKRTDDTIGMWSAHKPLTVPTTEYVRADIVTGLVEAAREAAPFIKNAFFQEWVKQALAAMDQH